MVFMGREENGIMIASSITCTCAFAAHLHVHALQQLKVGAGSALQDQLEWSALKSATSNDDDHDDCFEDNTAAQVEVLVETITSLYREISQLPDLRPSEKVNALFSELVGVCIRKEWAGGRGAEAVEEAMAMADVQEMRGSLIELCGRAEGLMESHYSGMIGGLPEPHKHLGLFPYYHNYKKLAQLEFRLLGQAHGHPTGATVARGASSPATMARNIRSTRNVAFVGSGPMPLSSIVLALHHLPAASFDNYDLDPRANALARGLVGGHPDLASRMAFHTCDVMEVTGERLAQYDVVFLAALVGLDRLAKAEVLAHLGAHMRAGASLVVRSAHGARAFLYPIVDMDLLQAPGFDVLSVFHPSDEVVNTVIVAKKR